MAGDDFDPCGTAEADATAFVPEPRQAAENELPADHIVLGYN
ncbi:hypothetical protein [Amycolatopsis sp. WAC 01416]|nr:hypothetical protein [Amycolatopsis sp. WAC 01416]